MERRGSRSQKGPYERKDHKKSFLSKMKDSFIGYVMYPSWLAGDDKDEKDGSDSKPSAPDQLPSTSSGSHGVDYPNTRQFQGQSSSMINGQPNSMDYGGNEQKSNPDIPFQAPVLPPPISEFTSSLLPLNRLTEKSDSVLANEDTLSQRSDASKSTSGCSSMVPQLESGRRDSGVEKRKAPDQETTSPEPKQTSKRPRLNMSVSTGNRSWTQKFNDSLSYQPAQSSLKRPAFDTSLFGSPLNTTSVLGTSFHESSFYPGKTVFGGRSSMRAKQKTKVDLNQSLPSRLTFPVKTFVKAKPRSKEAVTSSTAKRILDELGKVPTPLADAKKIPVILSRSVTQSPSFFSKEVSASTMDPPTRGMTVSSLARISENRQTSTGVRSQDMNMVRADSTSSRFSAVVPEKEEATTSFGKTRREKSYHRGSASVKPSLNQEDTVIITPNLKTDFTLPLTSTPKINIAKPKTPQNTVSNDTGTKPSALNFTFSSPVDETVPSVKPASPQNFSGFKFTSPISLEKKEDGKKSSSISGTQVTKSFGSFSSPSSMQMTFSTAPRPKAKINGPEESGFKPSQDLKQGSVMDILGGSRSSESSFKPAQELKQGSVMDILGGSKTTESSFKTAQELKQGSVMDILGGSKTSEDSFQPAKELKQGSVMDILGGSKTSTTPKKPAEKPEEPKLHKFVKVPGSWDCDTCLIQNKAEAKTCVACSASKPDMSNKPPWKKDDLSIKFKPPTGSWDCSVCLVQNKADAGSCVACQTPKPTKSFKHPAGDWECDTCLVNNKETAMKCIACTSPRPGPPRTQLVPNCVNSYIMSKHSQFSIGGTSTTDSSKDSSKSLNSGFKFGTATSSNTSGFKFGAISSSEAKTSESGSTLTTSALTSVTPSSGFKFGSLNSNTDESATPKSTVNIATGGFKFGTADTSSTQTTTNSDKSEKSVDEKKASSLPQSESGFKFASNTVSDKTSVNTPLSTSGFQFGSLSNKTNSTSGFAIGGFQFGSSSATSATTVPTTNLGVTSSGLTNSSVNISSSTVVSTSQTSVNSQVTFNSFTPNGGFTVPATSKATLGFNFATSVSKSGTATTSAPNMFTEFAVGSSKPADPVPKSEPPKPVFGGLSTEKPVAVSPLPSVGLFNSTQKKVGDNTMTNNFEAASTKRGCDEDTGETVAKKANFNFGSTNTSSSTLFQFGAASNNAAPQSNSSPLVFGQQNSNPSTTQTSTLAFGGAAPSGDTSKTLFGSSGSSNQASVAPVFGNSNPVFGFTAQKTQQSNSTPATQTGLFTLGASATKPAAPSVNFTFGGMASNNSSTSFGNSNSISAFGGNSQSTTPAFGSGNSGFGLSSTGQASTPAAPAFGGGGVFAFGGANSNAVGIQPQQPTNNLFQTGAKPAESIQPAAPASNTGYNFQTAAQAGPASSFSFSSTAVAPGTNPFSATPTPGTGERKIKKAVRKIRR